MSPWLLTLAVFWIYPLIFSLILSFSDYDVFHPELFSFVGWENYIRLWHDASFRQALFNTFIFVIGTTPVTTVLALVLALMINSVRRGSQVFRSVFFLPSIVSIVVTATIFKSFYSPIGLLNRIVEFFGFSGHGWLVEKAFAMPAIMMMNIWIILCQRMIDLQSMVLLIQGVLPNGMLVKAIHTLSLANMSCGSRPVRFNSTTNSAFNA